MTVIAPMMKTEENSAILVQNLSERRIPGMIIGGGQQGLIPFGTDLHISNPDYWPRSFHSDVFIGLTRIRSNYCAFKDGFSGSNPLDRWKGYSQTAEHAGEFTAVYGAFKMGTIVVWIGWPVTS